ncbi:hypothetical protein BGW80DRAFT_1446134 [Lactifluus volemus]|nr:hypothetical protein BGW80DRAFT_1446134 [Lactifluus volemus]
MNTTLASPPHRIPDRETPFSPFYSGIDLSLTTSQASLNSQASVPSLSSDFRSQHRYTLTNGTGNDPPWLTLILTSRSPRTKYLPMFIGSDDIIGSIEIDLLRPESIREVTVTLRGETTHLTQEPNVFLEMSNTLVNQPSGKLEGKHSFPFRFTLPTDITVYESSWAMVYPLPPTFHEKGILYIDYKVLVSVKRGKFSVGNSLTTNIVYLPETIAERPSSLREQSYLNESPLAPPSQDPRGWKMLPPVEAVGTLLPDTTVEAQLSIANPLCFALGTPIPIFLELRASGAAISGPQSIDIRLVRTLITRSGTSGARKVDVARAQIWEAPGGSPHNLKLWGELTVGRRLTPTFDFSRCSIRYSIVLNPRRAPDQTEFEPLVSEEVLLTLRNIPGIVPRSNAPAPVTPPPAPTPRVMPPRFFPVDFGLVRT